VISPTTNAVMMPGTSTMDLRQSQPAEQACVNSPNIDFSPGAGRTDQAHHSGKRPPSAHWSVPLSRQVLGLGFGSIEADRW